MAATKWARAGKARGAKAAHGSRKWSRRVMETSNALDLERGVFVQGERGPR